MSAGVLVLDSSALLKLVVAETETSVLQQEIEHSSEQLAGSELLLTEVRRAAARLGGQAPEQAARVLSLVTLMPVSRARLTVAGELSPPGLRSLDAIHVATALSVGPRLRAFVTYDERQAQAARSAGLDVLAPA